MFLLNLNNVIYPTGVWHNFSTLVDFQAGACLFSYKDNTYAVFHKPIHSRETNFNISYSEEMQLCFQSNIKPHHDSRSQSKGK